MTSEAYALIRYNTEYLLGQLPEPPNPHLIVKLTDSRGELIRGGSLQYYEGEWKAAGDRGDGTFEVATELPSVKLRMTYEHGVQEKSNVPAQSHTAVFRTIRAGVRLAGSSDSPMDTGRVQYYAGGWRDFGATLGGSTEKELLPANYKFRMTYAHGSNEKYQDIGADSVVVFRTVPATVELRNSAGNPTGSGEVKYYSGGWWDLGVTSGGAAVMELLPANYKFRMTYAKGSSEKYQDIGSNPVVTFQTVPARVELRNSAGVLMDQGDVKYYSGGWWDLGATSGGAAVMELLPANYKFRMTYAHGSNEKYQDIGSNPVVTFQAVPARVELRNSEGSLMDQGEVKYYSGGWWDLGTTSGGVAGMELLPANYKFRMTYARGSNEMYQDIGIEPLVRFGTVTALVRVMNQQGNPLSGAEVWYYSGGWYPLGSTGANGSVSMELLPLNYKFRARFGSIQSEKYQDVSVNPAVDFGLAVPGG